MPPSAVARHPNGLQSVGTALLVCILARCAPSLPSARPVTELSRSGMSPGAYLYVANAAIPSFGGSRIDIFHQANPSEGIIGTIRTGVSHPDGIFIDGTGTLYVANANGSGHGSVTVYPPGARKPERIYSGAGCAFDVAAGSDGTVYVADACGPKGGVGRVIIYPHGSTKNTRFLYPGGSPYCVTLDPRNNLYVGYNSELSYAGQVKRYAPGARKGVKLIPDNFVYFVTGIALDDRGALLVANQGDGVIDVFTTFGKPPSRIIKTGQSHPFAFAFDRREGRIYVSYPCTPGGLRSLGSSGCGKRPNTVVALDYLSGERLWTLQQRYWVPMGVAAEPSAPL